MATYNERGWRSDGVMQHHLRKICGYPRRHAVRWNDAETRDLIAQIEQGFRFEDIAEYHERSLNGLGARLRRVGYWVDPLSLWKDPLQQ